MIDEGALKRMDRMDEMRKRRERRIQHILNSETDKYALYEPHPARRTNSSYYERERELREDPEYEWHNRLNPWRSRPSWFERALRIQVPAAIIAFAAVWALFQWNHPTLGKAQRFVETSLTEDMDFTKLSAWYQDKLGENPAFIPTINRSQEEVRKANTSPSRAYEAPVKGNVVEPFGSVRAGAGIIISTASGAAVSSMDTGLITFAGETEETGMTVTVRHPGGVQTIYGNLGQIFVKENEWVEAGGKLGTVKSVGGQGKDGRLYFAVNRGGDYVNPLDVVPFE
jgi:stage IV sporulation protein FA